MLSYRKHGGKKEPPLHTVVGQAVYGKTRSRELLTSFNRIVASTSYKRGSGEQKSAKSYAVSCPPGDVPVPNHFSHEGWTMAAFDNSGYNDQSSLPGTSSRHYTASVMYQEVIGNPNPKPPVSSTDIRRSDRPRKDILSCQEVPKYFTPVIRPTLPLDMLLEENANNLLIHSRAEKALTEARRNDKLYSC